MLPGLRRPDRSVERSAVSRGRSGRRLALVAVAGGLFGCAPGVSYSGETRPQLVPARALASGDRAPAGQERLGRVSASCESLAVTGAFAGALLSEVSCSLPLLLAALRDHAASVGGTFLLEPRCDADGGSPPLELSCEAELWGPVDAAGFVAPETPTPINVDALGPAAPGAPAWGSVTEAWQVRLDFHPAGGWRALPPLRPDEVHEVAFARVQERPLGDLVAYCEPGEQCAAASVRAALRAAAARLGASALVGVRCIRESGATRCIGSLGAPIISEAQAG
jgi:hypothetical protein